MALTKEEIRERKRISCAKYRANLTHEQKENKKIYAANWRRNMTDEQKERDRLSKAKWEAKNREKNPPRIKLTDEEKLAKRKLVVKRSREKFWVNATDDQKAKRREYYRLQAAKYRKKTRR